MQQGFHATLFQFRAIARCPIHDERLLEACPGCGGRIAYRLDPAFAANPFACPRCSQPLLADATVLMQPGLGAAACATLLAWQRFLGRYASWYAFGPRVRHAGVSADLGFIGTLQGVMREPPSVPSIGSMRMGMSPWPARQAGALVDRFWNPSFTVRRWPHFRTRSFVGLCRRYTRFHDLRLRHDSLFDREVTHWWRRSWEGAIARPCTADVAFEEPPFGIAEWVAFSPVDWHESAKAVPGRLAARFEEDLQLTWDAWSAVMSQVPSSEDAALHPSIVPPRGCWLAEPVIGPEAPALGLF